MQIYLLQLIDKASEATGGDTKLAAELLVSKTVVSDWRHGRRRCSAPDMALMAALAGLDADAWAARGVIDSYEEGSSKRAKLQAALKKALLVTGGVTLSSSVNAAPVISAAREVLYTMYMMFTRKCTFSRGTLSIRGRHGRFAPYPDPKQPGPIRPLRGPRLFI